MKHTKQKYRIQSLKQFFLGWLFNQTSTQFIPLTGAFYFILGCLDVMYKALNDDIVLLIHMDTR